MPLPELGALEPALPLLPDELGPLAPEPPLLELEPALLLELDELLELGELDPLDAGEEAPDLEGEEGAWQRASSACWRRTAHHCQQTDQCACREPAHKLGLMRAHEKWGSWGVSAIAYEPVGFRSKDHTIISVATGLPPSLGRKRFTHFLSKRSTLGSLLIGLFDGFPLRYLYLARGLSLDRCHCETFVVYFRTHSNEIARPEDRFIPLLGGSERMPSMSGRRGDSNSAARIWIIAFPQLNGQ